MADAQIDLGEEYLSRARSYSAPISPSSISETPSLKTRSITTGNLNLVSDESTVPSRKVKFSCVARAVLIPTRSEFYDLQLNDSLWWTQRDYENFKETAREQLRKQKNASKIVTINDE